eukprot:jgi/Mesvir1/10941/Mv11482-RA.1
MRHPTCIAPACVNVDGKCFKPISKYMDERIYGPYGSGRKKVAKLANEEKCRLVRKFGDHFDRRVTPDSCVALSHTELVKGVQMNRWKHLSGLLKDAYPDKSWLRSIADIEKSEGGFVPMQEAIHQAFFEEEFPYPVAIRVNKKNVSLKDGSVPYAYTTGFDVIYLNRPVVDNLVRTLHGYHHASGKGRAEFALGPTRGAIITAAGVPLTLFTPLAAVAAVLVHEYIHVVHAHCRRLRARDTITRAGHGRVFRRMANLFTGTSYAKARLNEEEDVTYVDGYPDDDTPIVEAPDLKPDEVEEMRATLHPDAYPNQQSIQNALKNLMRKSQNDGDNYMDIRFDTKKKAVKIVHGRRIAGPMYIVAILVNGKLAEEYRVAPKRRIISARNIVDFLHRRNEEFPVALATALKVRHLRTPNSDHLRASARESFTLSKMDEVESMRRGKYPMHTLDDSSKEFRARVEARKVIYRAIENGRKFGDNNLLVEVREDGVDVTSRRVDPKEPYIIDYQGIHDDYPVEMRPGTEHATVSFILDLLYHTYPKSLDNVRQTNPTFDTDEYDGTLLTMGVDDFPDTDELDRHFGIGEYDKMRVY